MFQNDITRGNSAFQNFLYAQIKLLVMMCKGYNTSVIEALQDLPGTEGFGVKINFPLIMSAINDKNLRKKNPELRALLVELLIGAVSITDYSGTSNNY